MAVTRVAFRGLHSLTYDGSTITGKLRYQVETDDPADGALLVANASDGVTTIPVVGTVANGLTHKSVQAEVDTENPTFWDVDVEVFAGAEEGGGGAVKWDVEISGAGIGYTEDVHRDRDFKPILNKAGQPFSPALQKTYYDSAITIRFKTRADVGAVIEAMRGQINAGAFTLSSSLANPPFSRSFEAETVMLAGESTYALVLGQGYFQINLVLHYRRDKWTRKVLNVGTMHRKGGPGTSLEAIYVGGVPTTEPVPLDANGKWIGPTADPLTTAIVCEFELEFANDFAGLFEGI